MSGGGEVNAPGRAESRKQALDRIFEVNASVFKALATPRWRVCTSRLGHARAWDELDEQERAEIIATFSNSDPAAMRYMCWERLR